MAHSYMSAARSSSGRRSGRAFDQRNRGVPSSMVRAYKERCLGSSRSAVSSDFLPVFQGLSRQPIDQIQAEIFKSGLARPFDCVDHIADLDAGALTGAARQACADCIPKLMPVKPGLRRSGRYSGETVPGLASRVVSRPGSSQKPASSASTDLCGSIGMGTSEGVPPPKKRCGPETLPAGSRDRFNFRA